MIPSIAEVSQLFRPDDDNLSRESMAQVQLHRVLSLLGVIVFPVFGILYEVSNPQAIDPVWDQYVVAGLFVGLFGASYVSRRLRAHYVLGFWILLHVVMTWVALITALNGFASDYVVSLLLTYAVVGVTLGLGARSFRPILRFLGFGVALVVGSIMMTPTALTSPSVLLASMATVALIEGIALWGRLSIQEELAERERQLRSINENVSEGIYRSTPDEGIVYANQALAQMFGYESPEAVCQADATNLYADPEMRERLRETSRAKGGIEPTEVLLRRRDGSTFFALMSGTIVYDDDGAVKYYDGAVTDITERKETEQALQEERDRLATLFETLPTPVIRCEVCEDGTLITDTNPAFEEVFGVDFSSAKGKDVDALLVPEADREEAAEIDRRALEEGTQQVEVKRKAADGLRDFRLQVAGRTREGGPPEIYGIYTDITQRKQWVQKLRRRLDAMEAASDGIAILDSEEEYIYVNQAHAEIHGYDSPDAFLGETWELCYGEKELRRFKEEVMPMLSEAGNWRGEATGKRADGSHFPQEVTLTTLESGGLICVVRDITEQKEREQKLRKTRNFYEQILDQVPIDLAVLDPDARYEYVNSNGVSDPALREWIVGRTNEEYCRERGLDPDLGRRRDEAVREAARTKERVELEETLEGEDGPRHYYRVYSPIVDLGDQVTSVAAFGFEISERKEMEERLRERRQKLESLYRATGRLLTAENREEIGRHVHDVLQEVFDYPMNNVGFVSDGMIVPSKTTIDEENKQAPVPEPIPVDEETIAGRALRSGEVVVAPDPGPLDNNIDYGDLGWASVPIGDHGVVVIGFENEDDIAPFDLRLIEVLATYASVILGRLQHEEELRLAKEEAERMNRLKSAFLANMSHEIRTPLTSVIGFAEAIGDQVEVLEEQPEDADFSQLGRFSGLIEQGGMRLLETLDGVLNLSKLQAGQMSLASEPVDLSANAKTVAEEHRPQAQKAGVRLSVESPHSPVWAEADEGGVQIIAQNLISNAIKYTEEGGRVWIRTYREADQAVFEVEDTGIGMAPEMAEDLFEPFRQASEGTGRVYEGTGVGLTVTKQTIERMDGQIKVRTEKGEGSRFIVRLPRKASVSNEPKPSVGVT